MLQQQFLTHADSFPQLLQGRRLAAAGNEERLQPPLQIAGPFCPAGLSMGEPDNIPLRQQPAVTLHGSQQRGEEALVAAPRQAPLELLLPHPLLQRVFYEELLHRCQQDLMQLCHRAFGKEDPRLPGHLHDAAGGEERCQPLLQACSREAGAPEQLRLGNAGEERPLHHGADPQGIVLPLDGLQQLLRLAPPSPAQGREGVQNPPPADCG